MVTRVGWVLSFGLLAIACVDGDRDPRIGDRADFDDSQVRGSLAYGQTARDRLASGSEQHGYRFSARRGDVVSLYAIGAHQGSDKRGPDLHILLLDPERTTLGNVKAAGANDLIAAAAHIRGVEIEQDGEYIAVISGFDDKEAGDYRLRLACDAGPCAPTWHTRSTGNCEFSPVADAVAKAAINIDSDTGQPLHDSTSSPPIAPELVATTRNAVGPILRSHARQLFRDELVSGEPLSSRFDRGPLSDADYPYPTIYPALGDLIAGARFEVDIRIHRTDNSDPRTEILDGIARLHESVIEASLAGQQIHARPVIVRIFVNEGNAEQFLKDVHRMGVSHSLVEVQVTSFQPPLVPIPGFPAPGLDEDHAKIAIIDGAYVHIGGANPTKGNSYDRPEHDSAYLIKGEVAQAALADFDFGWTHPDTRLHTCEFNATGQVCDKSRSKRIDHDPRVLSPDWDEHGLPESACMPMVYLGNRGSGFLFIVGSDDHPIADGYYAAFRHAQEQILLTSPNLIEDEVVDQIAAALERGVATHAVIPMTRNGLLEALDLSQIFTGSSNGGAFLALKAQVDDAAQALLDFRWHAVGSDGPGAAHVKYATFDRRVVFVGSTNLDRQSFRRAREVNIVIDDEETARRIEQAVFDRDFELGNPAQ